MCARPQGRNGVKKSQRASRALEGRPVLDTVWGQAALRLEYRQHPTPWAQNGSQTSSFRLCNIYAFLYLVTQGHMVLKEALSSPREGPTLACLHIRSG